VANLTLSAALDTAHVRLAELGRALLDAQARDNEGDVTRLVSSILHLRLALEDAARLPALSPEQAQILSYLCETYGLAYALTDPLLRSLLPAIPADGATVRYKVLGLNGKAVTINGKLIAVGASLQFSTAP
jgi:hypothetical protein